MTDLLQSKIGKAWSTKNALLAKQSDNIGAQVVNVL
jgi:hypothetical protein